MAPPYLWLSLVSLLVKGMTVLIAVMEIQTAVDVDLLWHERQPTKQPNNVLLELYIKEAKPSHSQPVYGLQEKQLPPSPALTRLAGRSHQCTMTSPVLLRTTSVPSGWVGRPNLRRATFSLEFKEKPWPMHFLSQARSSQSCSGTPEERAILVPATPVGNTDHSHKESGSHNSSHLPN